MPLNTPELRENGIYTLHGVWLIAKKRAEGLFFLYSQRNWDCLGAVDYRLSHGLIFQHGRLTKWIPTDLIDTGKTADAPLHGRKQ